MKSNKNKNRKFSKQNKLFPDNRTFYQFHKKYFQNKNYLNMSVNSHKFAKEWLQNFKKSNQSKENFELYY